MRSLLAYPGSLNNTIHEDEMESYENEVREILSSPQLPATKNNDGDEIKCLLWLFKQRKQYPLIFRMVFTRLLNVESGFSVKGYVIDKKSGRKNTETYLSIQAIKYGLRGNSLIIIK